MRVKSLFLSFFTMLFTTALVGLPPTVFGQQENRPLSFIAPSAESYVFDLQWGELGSLNDEFNTPEGIAADKLGNILVADTNNHRVLKFDASGVFLFSFGAFGPGNGQFSSPHGIAVDRKGNIWVADTNNNRVQKFTSTGQFLCQAGGLTKPHGVAAHPSQDIVIVANTGANAVVKIDSTTCDNIGGWGSTGSADGQFNFPHDVAVDKSGGIYVADYNNNRIQVFDSSGTFQRKWGTGGAGDSRFTASPQFSGPAGVEVDGCGDIFVTDFNNRRVQKFTSDGTFITIWGWGGSGSGQFDRPTGIAVDMKGRVFVVDTFNHRIQRFSPSTIALTHLFKNKWGGFGSTESQFSSPFGIAVNTNTGNIYVADTSNHRIQEFDASGTFIRKWGSSGPDSGEFLFPQGVAVDSNTGEVYVADTNNHRIQVFDAMGTFVRKWGSSGSDNGDFSFPQGVSVDSNTAEVYVADTSNHRVQKFTSAGVFIRGFGNGIIWSGVPPTPAASNPNGWFNSPRKVAVSGGVVYVADTNNNRIQKFTGNGGFLTKWGASGSGNGQFSSPWGIAVDGGGDVFVVDNNHRVQKFKSDGRFVSKWASLGSGAGVLDGLLNSPRGIVVDSTSNFIYVADTSNHRIQRFERFGFSLAITPPKQTITKGDVATYTLTLSGVGPNTLGMDVSFCILSGRPNATTVDFSPVSVEPGNGGAVTSTLTLDTSNATLAKTYTFLIEAKGGGQTRIRSAILKVANPQ